MLQWRVFKPVAKIASWHKWVSWLRDVLIVLLTMTRSILWTKCSGFNKTSVWLLHFGLSRSCFCTYWNIQTKIIISNPQDSHSPVYRWQKRLESIFTPRTFSAAHKCNLNAIKSYCIICKLTSSCPWPSKYFCLLRIKYQEVTQHPEC